MCGGTSFTGVLGKLPLFGSLGSILFLVYIEPFFGCVGPFFLERNLWFLLLFFALETSLDMAGSTDLMALFSLF